MAVKIEEGQAYITKKQAERDLTIGLPSGPTTNQTLPTF